VSDRLAREPSLADLISLGLGSSAVHFLDENRHVNVGELWDHGARVSAINDGPTAMLLSNTVACVTCLLGAIQSGLTVVSLPLPPRGGDLIWYQKFVESVCRSSQVRRLVLDAELISLVPPMAGIEILAYETVLHCRPSRDVSRTEFELVQFTSGSTSNPKGIRLTQRMIVANILAILNRLEVGPGDGACSWLPLSHDMGLIGMLLSSLVAGGPQWADGTETVIMSPSTFLKRPANWLLACEQFSSTITCTPNFGMEMAVKRRGSSPNLQSVRACIIGGEPIRPSTLQRFSEAFAAARFDPIAFCPAYGLAEAALAVSMVAPSEEWNSVRAPSSATGHGAVSAESVSAGRSLTGYQVRIAGDDPVGDVLVKGPSVLDRYSDGTPARDEHGWFHTGDIGFMKEDQIHILGRSEDFFSIAGRKIYAIDVESAMDDLPGLRLGRSAAVESHGTLTVFAEVERDLPGGPQADSELIQAIRLLLVHRGLPAPGLVVLIEAGTLPMTSSGKLQRSVIKQRWRDGTLEVRCSR
jgi:acyl-CoA synthetase (AMP-forming)/AMP-acid ligase II